MSELKGEVGSSLRLVILIVREQDSVERLDSLFIQGYVYLGLGVDGGLGPRKNEIHSFRRIQNADGIDEVGIFSYLQAAIYLNDPELRVWDCE